MGKAIYNAPHPFSIRDFSLGWDLVSSPTSLDVKSLRDCLNMNLTPSRGIEKRRGITKLIGIAALTSTAIKDLFEYKAPNGTNYILAAVGTFIKGWNGAGWGDFKDGLTAGKRFKFTLHQDFCYAVNGVNANIKFLNDVPYQVGIAPPAAKPTIAEGVATGLTGKYTYVYCYKRTTRPFVGNPSPVSDAIVVSDKNILVSVIQSADTQVDKIVIYRSYDWSLSGEDPGEYWKVVELNNTTQQYSDSILDENLGMSVDFDNTVPPKAKFVVVYKDMVVYANCPDMTDGKSLFVYSKKGVGDAVPSTNYEYFDRGDGNEITGIAVLPDYLVIFKKNKFAVIQGDFEAKVSIAPTYGIGGIAPWAILQREDEIIFLSEEGWKAFDGVNLYPISEKINSVIAEGYATLSEAENYSAVVYSERDQFYYLSNHSTLAKQVFVGHFLVPLLYIDKGIPEQKSENIVSWTYHRYPNQVLTCLAQFTDTNGVSRIMAGSSTGYVYELDTGSKDDGELISFKIQSGWFRLGTPEDIEHTVRVINVTYVTDVMAEIIFDLEINFLPRIFTETLYGVDATYCGYAYCGYAYCGIEGGVTDMIKATGTGQWFRYSMEGEAEQSFLLNSVAFRSRIEGTR